MQRRVNRWLSAELLASVPQRAPELTFEASLEAPPCPPTGLRWQRLAALALLLGSAAFSYVAWSDVGPGLPGAGSLFSRAATAPASNESGASLTGDRVLQVRELREENRRLHGRLEELRHDLASLARADHTP